MTTPQTEKNLFQPFKLGRIELANRIVMGVGKYLSHEDLIAAFTLRSKRLVTQEALAAGIAQARVGNHVGDIGHAVQAVAEGAGNGMHRVLVLLGVLVARHECAREAGVGTATLDPLEGLTKGAEADGADYFTVMRANLATLRKALRCRS